MDGMLNLLKVFLTKSMMIVAKKSIISNKNGEYQISHKLYSLNIKRVPIRSVQIFL